MRYQKDYRDNIEELKSLIVPVALSSPMAAQSSGAMGGGINKGNTGGMSSSMGGTNQASLPAGQAGVIPQAPTSQNDFSLTSTNQNAVTYLPLA